MKGELHTIQLLSEVVRTLEAEAVALRERVVSLELTVKMHITNPAVVTPHPDYPSLGRKLGLPDRRPYRLAGLLICGATPRGGNAP